MVVALDVNKHLNKMSEKNLDKHSEILSRFQELPTNNHATILVNVAKYKICWYFFQLLHLFTNDWNEISLCRL